ncbi:MAG: hypothetical protein PHH54_05445 [Candidatus Nanoarchaeia archaeon]|nr:hypothetical protein [Candidatus Nanoarchaeia archaeon]MDD5741403.1 hypothetical protein [Candidatus Nanoarchaeia archaeon]
MKLNTLKVSIIISLIGIFLLLFLSSVLEPRVIKIKDIDDNLMNKRVKIEGEILDTKIYASDFQIISIKDETGKIDMTISAAIDKLKNKEVMVIGTIQEYEGHLQIQADKIVLK